MTYDVAIDAVQDSSYRTATESDLREMLSSAYPILVRLSSASGHGMGTSLSEKIAQRADVLAFLFDQLKMSKR